MVGSNPIVGQAVRASRWPSARMTLVLLAGLWAAAFAARGWLTNRAPDAAGMIRALLVLAAWLTPLLTAGEASIAAARRLQTQPFQLVRQSPLDDSQVVWGYGLATLYRLRLALVGVFGLLPALVDDTLAGGLGLGLCLAGLHLLGALLGTALILRWGRERLDVVLAALGWVLVLALLRGLDMLSSGALSPGCPSTSFSSLTPARFRLSVLLIRRGLQGPTSAAGAVALLVLLCLLARRIAWREGRRARLVWPELVGSTLALLLLLDMDIMLIRSSERRALVTLYRATGGKEWYRSDLWLSDRPICEWFGVMCACGNTNGLQLGANCLRGEIPPELQQLTNLQHLYLFGGQLTEVPPEIGQLTNLHYLYLSDNQLAEVPPELGQLTSLQALRLSGNHLREIPPELGHLTGLQSLDLSNNQLTEVPPEIGQLVNLYVLHLSNNRLTEVPLELGQLTNLHYLYLSGNQLTEVPPEVCQLPNLVVIEPAWLCEG